MVHNYELLVGSVDYGYLMVDIGYRYYWSSSQWCDAKHGRVKIRSLVIRIRFDLNEHMGC